MQKALPPGVAAEYEKTLGKYGEDIRRYDGEKKEIKGKAEPISKGKLKAQEMGGNFAFALIFLQIALMLSSLKKRDRRITGPALLFWIYTHRRG